MTANVFVVGLDDVNRAKLESIRDAAHYRFHELLSLYDVQGADRYPVAAWIADMEAELEAFDGSIDGIIGFWDFPVSLIVPVLRSRFGTHGPTLESVVRCEHKYWSRRLQHEVIPDAVPRFEAVDPFAEDAAERLEIEPPFWLKPVKAFASQLGFRIDDRADLDRALEKIREGIPRFAEPFDHMLERVDRPPEIAPVTGSWCLAEEILERTQHTVAGFARDGHVEIYGVIDSINYPDSPSFFRYHYPSRLPEDVQRRAGDLARAVAEHVGFRDWPFNVEFFYDESEDRLALLEFNTRISQSHSDLFRKVDGVSNHEVLVRLATGGDPEPPDGDGPAACAGKFHLRHFEDGKVTRIPDGDDIARLKDEIPDAIVLVQVDEGDRLAELPDQDAYSYRLGVVYLGGEDEERMLRKWERARELLPFEIDGERI